MDKNVYAFIQISIRKNISSIEMFFQINVEPSDMWGMWDIERYIYLVMGEIPRLLEDANGYGPNRRHYIAHVDIPEHLLKAFDELKEEYGDLIRVANPLYALK
jgi:hypothetical protein